MEITNALLVALMFITILTIGIGNVLSAITTMVIKGNTLSLNRIFSCWVILLLLLLLSQFWETLVILEKESWNFGGFVTVLIGPMLLLVASQLVVAPPKEGVTDYSREHYDAISRRFFMTQALVMVWAVVMDGVLGVGINTNSAWDIVLLVIFLLMAFSRSQTIHNIVTLIAVIVMITLFALRGSGVVG